MGLRAGRDSDYGRDFRALHQVVLSWTQRNYLRLVKGEPIVANAVLIGGITFDETQQRLVKTYAKLLGKEGTKEYLALQSS